MDKLKSGISFSSLGCGNRGMSSDKEIFGRIPALYESVNDPNVGRWCIQNAAPDKSSRTNRKTASDTGKKRTGNNESPNRGNAMITRRFATKSASSREECPQPEKQESSCNQKSSEMAQISPTTSIPQEESILPTRSPAVKFSSGVFSVGNCDLTTNIVASVPPDSVTGNTLIKDEDLHALPCSGDSGKWKYIRMYQERARRREARARRKRQREREEGKRSKSRKRSKSKKGRKSRSKKKRSRSKSKSRKQKSRSKSGKRSRSKTGKSGSRSKSTKRRSAKSTTRRRRRSKA